MAFIDFEHEWLGRSVDYDHILRFEAMDLIQQYLYEVYQVNVRYTTPIDFLTNLPSNVANVLEVVTVSELLPGDIVILHDPEHIVLATGNQNNTDFEALEQNGHTGDQSLQDGDTVRTRYIARSRIQGILRAKAVSPIVEPEVMSEVPTEVTPFLLTPPAAPVPVPLLSTPLTLVTSVMGYSTKTEAFHDLNAKVALPEGEYLLFRTAENGMQYVGQTRGGIKYWINPADNRLPDPEPVEEVVSKDWVNPRAVSVEPEPTPEPVVEAEPQPVVEEDWKLTYEPFYPPREYVANIDGRIWNLDEHGRELNATLRKKKAYYVYGTVERDGQKWYRLKIQSDTKFELWACVPMEFNGRAVLVLAGPSWADYLFHGWQTTKRASEKWKKSIFSSGEPQLIDNVRNERIDRINK